MISVERSIAAFTSPRTAISVRRWRPSTVRCPRPRQRFFLQAKIGAMGRHARPDVRPTGAARSMGGGLRAYVLRMGYATQRGDLVEIFDPAGLAEIGTVGESRRFFEAWVNSLA